MSASSAAAVGPAGAIPSRAEAGIAVAIADTTIAAPIRKIRLILRTPGRGTATCRHKLRKTNSFPLPGKSGKGWAQDGCPSG
jgi:hypothetical protein